MKNMDADTGGLANSTWSGNAFFVPGSYDDLAALRTGNPSSLKLQIDSDAEIKLRRHSHNAEAQNVLVLGGNGFAGIHLIDRLITDTRVNRIYAVVRAAGNNTPEERIQKMREQYRLDWGGCATEKLVCLDGSAIDPRFGLSAEDFENLVYDVGSVFQCASTSDYTTSYLEIRPYWVTSLWRVIEFCLTGTIKHLTYMGSSISHLYQSEVDFKRPNSWWYSGYAQMKWVNQNTLRLLGEEYGLPITIAECPYILGSTTIGLDRGMEYSFWRMHEIAHGMGLMWDHQGIDFVPVDLLADMLVENLFGSHPKSLLAPRTPRHYQNDIIAKILDCKLIDYHEFWQQGHTQYSAHRIGTMFPEDIPELVRKTNVSPIFPADYDTGLFPEVRDLFIFYFNNLNLRDVRLRSFRHTRREIVKTSMPETPVDRETLELQDGAA